MPDFWNEYEGRPSGSFVSDEEKTELIANASRVEISAVNRAKGQYGEQYLLTVRLEKSPDEQRVLAFSADSNVTSRNDMLEQMKEFLTKHPTETILVRITQNGRVRLLEPAEA